MTLVRGVAVEQVLATRCVQAGSAWRCDDTASGTGARWQARAAGARRCRQPPDRLQFRYQPLSDDRMRPADFRVMLSSLRFIPNALCFLRMLLVVPVAWLLLAPGFRADLWLFAFAAATDGLDGFLAKRCGWTSELGKILDPLADKILLVGIVPHARDHGPGARVAGGHCRRPRRRHYGRRDPLQLAVRLSATDIPTWISKLNTLCQIVFLLLIVAAHAVGHVPQIAIYCAGCAGVRHDGSQRHRLRDHLCAQGDRGESPAPRRRGLSAAPVTDHESVNWRWASSCATARCSRATSPAAIRSSSMCCVAVHAGTPPTCVYLQGPPGTGKTHCCRRCARRAGTPGLPRPICRCAELCGMGPEMLSGCGELDIVCVDDVEHDRRSRRLESRVVRAASATGRAHGRLVVASAAAAGSAWHCSCADLRSRLARRTGADPAGARRGRTDRGAAVARAIAWLRAADETAQYLLRRLPRDMTSLCAFLDQLDDASLVAQRRLTVPFVREVMERATQLRRDVHARLIPLRHRPRARSLRHPQIHDQPANSSSASARQVPDQMRRCGFAIASVSAENEIGNDAQRRPRIGAPIAPQQPRSGAHSGSVSTTAAATAAATVRRTVATQRQRPQSARHASVSAKCCANASAV